MTDKQVVKNALKFCKWSQQKLAEEAGFKGQSNITSYINNNKNAMRVDKLVRMMNAMGFEVVVRDKRGTGTEFILDMVDREINLDALLGD